MRIDMTGNQRYVPKSHAKLEVPYIIYMVMTMMVTMTIMMLISLMLQMMTMIIIMIMLANLLLRPRSMNEYVLCSNVV